MTSWLRTCYAAVLLLTALLRCSGDGKSHLRGDYSTTRGLVEHVPPNCNPAFHNIQEVQETVAKARVMVENFPTSVPIEGRLAIMILFSGGFDPNSKQIPFLKCALNKLKANLMPSTTADVFIWVPEGSEQINRPEWLNEKEYPRVHVIGMPKITWEIPCGLIPDEQFAMRDHFTLDYYRMGRWRLTFSMDFVKEMGYKYKLQFDDDAMLQNQQNYDIVAKMKDFDMGVFSDHIGEPVHVVAGLPELTKYWLYVNHYNPKGALMDHINPKDDKFTGLTTEGWDRMYHPGYFVIISVDWWFSERQQNYLTTVLRSGRDVEGRWQEQAVQNMMRLLFIPKERLWIAYEVDIGHDRHHPANFQKWCVEQNMA